MSLHFADVADHVPDWLAIKRNAKGELTVEQASEVPALAASFSEILTSPEADELIDPAIPREMRELSAPLADGDGWQYPGTVLNAATEALAVDVLNGIDNTLKQLARAALWLRDSRAGKLAKEAGKEGLRGFEENLPKQTKKLGELMAKVIVWGPATILGGAFAAKFAWFVPVAQFLRGWLLK